MPIDHRDEASLSFYFRAASLFQRSTFGAQLDRARAARSGRPASWAWLPPSSGLNGPIHVSAGREASQGYEVDHGDLLRFSRVSRRVQLASRAEGVFDVLAAYYGDRGARWQATAAGRTDPERGAVVIEGRGPGAIAALYAMTPAGRALIDRERRPAGARADDAALRAARRGVAEAERAHGVAADALRAAMLASHAARQVGAVPPSERGVLHAARAAVAEAQARLEDARRRLDLLSRPYQAPRREEQRPLGAEGPLLADGRWSPADPVPMLRVAAPPAGPAGADRGHLTDDELLEVLFILEAVSSKPDRKRRLSEARDQAEALLVRAWEAWLGTAPVVPRCPFPASTGAGSARPVAGGRRGGVRRHLDPRFARGAQASDGAGVGL